MVGRTREKRVGEEEEEEEEETVSPSVQPVERCRDNRKT